MNTILDYLGSDHRACDDLFAAAEESVAQRDWPHAARLFAQFHHAMQRHFQMEERVLFPSFEAKTGQTLGPTEVMRMEHAQMRDLLQGMEAALAAQDEQKYLGLSETLNMLMQQHNLKEENVLYPMSDRVLASERDGLIRQMDDVDQA